MEIQGDTNLDKNQEDSQNNNDSSLTNDAYDGPDRRGQSTERRNNSVDRRSDWDRRRGPGRRRTDDRRAAEEGEMNDEQFSFIMAIDQYKRANKKNFPTYTEILEIAKALGYRKVAEPEPLNTTQSD